MRNCETTAYRVPTPGGALQFLYMSSRWEKSVGLVVVAPGYEHRIHHYSLLAHYLVDHGFDVLRFDLRNHIGLSEGEIADFTMTSMANDIGDALLDARGRCTGLPISVVASSLASRAAVRATYAASERGDALVHALVMILPVVDVEYSTTRAIGRNAVEEWRTGAVTDPTRLDMVLSHEVAYSFARDVIDGGWSGIDGTRQELEGIDTDVLAIAAAEDTWVELDDVERTIVNAGDALREIVVLESCSHELAFNAPVVRLLMEEVISWLWQRHGQAPTDVTHPEFQEIVAIMDRERGWKAEGYACLQEHRRQAHV
jgi:alpha-beta hydrolase superfamily lysophospholipase